MDQVIFGGRSFKNSGRADGDADSSFYLQIKLVLCLQLVLEIEPLSCSVALHLGKFTGSESNYFLYYVVMVSL